MYGVTSPPCGPWVIMGLSCRKLTPVPRFQPRSPACPPWALGCWLGWLRQPLRMSAWAEGRWDTDLHLLLSFIEMNGFCHGQLVNISGPKPHRAGYSSPGSVARAGQLAVVSAPFLPFVGNSQKDSLPEQPFAWGQVRSWMETRVLEQRPSVVDSRSGPLHITS